MTTLDKIVKNVLVKRGYPIHFYVQFLTYARDCLRTLSFDDLHIINTVILNIDNAFTVDLPTDYLDLTKIGIMVGQYVKPLVKGTIFNRLPNVDSTGTPIPYSTDPTISTNTETYYSITSPYWSFVPFDDYGERTGRAFGAGAGVENDIYMIIPERNKIQLVENINATQVVLEYISTNAYANAATQLTDYAYETIEAYIIWQMKEANRNYNMGERQLAREEYLTQRKIFRRRMNPMTMDDLKRIVNRNYRASVK